MIITPKTNESSDTPSNREWVAEKFPDAVIAKGYDHCIVGVTPEGSVIYAADEIIKTLVGMEHDWDFDDAIEWFERNIEPSFNSDKKNHPKFMFNSNWMFQ